MVETTYDMYNVMYHYSFCKAFFFSTKVSLRFKMPGSCMSNMLQIYFLFNFSIHFWSPSPSFRNVYKLRNFCLHSEQFFNLSNLSSIYVYIKNVLYM